VNGKKDTLKRLLLQDGDEKYDGRKHVCQEENNTRAHPYYNKNHTKRGQQLSYNKKKKRIPGIIDKMNPMIL